MPTNASGISEHQRTAALFRTAARATLKGCPYVDSVWGTAMRPTRLLSLAIVALFCAAQANTLRAQDRTGWQSLFDGKTLNGWHASVPPPRTPRGGAPQAPTPGQIGTPQPCGAAAAAASA